MYIPGQVVLHDYARQLDQPHNRTVILECLSEIYEKNKVLVQSYLTVETRLLFVFGVSAVSSLQKYETISNEARNEALDMCRANGFRQKLFDSIPAETRGPVRRHVPPNCRPEQSVKPNAIPVLNRREQRKAEQSVRPFGRGIHPVLHKKEPKAVPAG